MSPSRVTVGLLGPLELGFDGRPVDLPRPKERTLLALLALRVNQAVSIEHLAAGLWDSVEAPRPPATLRVHLSRLRQTLATAGAGPYLQIRLSGHGYVLDAPAPSIDAWRFEQITAAGRQRLAADDPEAAAELFGQALALWRGRVLEDLYLSPAVEPELARLEEARLAALEDRIDADLRCGRHHEVAGELEQLVAESPLRERLWGQRMVALYRGGRQAEALRAYTDLRVHLAETLGIGPSPELQRLERSILDQDSELDLSPAPPSPAHLPRARLEPAPWPSRLSSPVLLRLCGRAAPFDSLLHAWKEAAGGETQTVFLSGEAGIGKTRLASEVARRAFDSGGVVLFGRCDEDVAVPYQPFVEALEEAIRAQPVRGSFGRHAGELARLVPDLPGLVPGLEPPLATDPDTERYRLFAAVASWLAASSARTGLMLVIDDLHWADHSTMLLLRYLARSAQPMRLLTVCTYRDTDIGPDHRLAELLADLRREPAVHRMALGGLDLAGVLDMIGNACGEPPDTSATDLGRLVWAETAGNPFFIQEILRGLVDSGVLVARNGVVTTDRPVTDQMISDLGIPDSVRELVNRRMSRLSADAKEVLSVASVIGTQIDFDLLVELSGLGDEAVLDALDAATTYALLQETATGTYEFTHALVRSTLYEQLGASRRARRHRQIAAALETPGEHRWAPVAYHLGRAGVRDHRTVEYATAAGRDSLERLAFGRAVHFYSQAVDAADAIGAPTNQRCDLLVHLGTAQRLAAVPAYRQTLFDAAQMAQNLGDPHLLARAALANNRGFGSDVGAVDEERVSYIEAAIDAVGPADSAMRARLMSVLALEIIWRDPHLRRLTLVDDAAAMARRLGDDGCLLQARAAAQVAAAIPDRVPSLVAEVPGILGLAEQRQALAERVLVCSVGARHCLELGDLAAADRLTGRLRDLTAEFEVPLFKWMLANGECCRLSVSGTGNEIEQAATEAFRLGEAAGQPDLIRWFAPQLFVARWAQGRLGEMVELAAHAADEAPGLPVWRAGLAVAHAASGDRAVAASIVTEIMGQGEAIFPVNIAWLLGHSVLGEAVADVGTPEQARREYAILEPYAGRVPCVAGVARPGINLWLAVLAARGGSDDRAESHFAAAHQQHADFGASVWMARTDLEWGRFLLDRGESERARPLIERAQAAAERAGAAAVSQTAAALL